MKQFTILDKTYEIKTDWNELTIQDFINIENHKKKQIFTDSPELWSIELFEMLSKPYPNDSNTAYCNTGDLDNITMSDLNDLVRSMNFLSSEMENKLNRFIDLNGEKYMFPKSLDEITAGEYISIKTIQESSTDELDSMIKIISVVLRPCHYDEKRGEWIVDKFNTRDYELRLDKIKKWGKAVEIINYINFFLTGNEQSTTIDTKNYSNPEHNQEV